MTGNIPLSPEEIDICRCVAANRINLQGFFSDFTVAVQMFEFLERSGAPPQVGILGGVFIQFRVIAAKQGALSIYHFGNTLNFLRKQVLRCPSTQATDVFKLKEAFGLFGKYFPHAENTRHGIAHAGEIWASTSTAKEHTPTQDYHTAGVSAPAGVFIQNALFERTYSLVWKGKVFEVHMNMRTVEKMREILTLAYSAFPQYPIEP